MDIYKLLPKNNCGKCGEASCMAFATKLMEKEASIDQCPLLEDNEREKLENLLAPAVKEIEFGSDEQKVVIGGDEVLYRYELTYYNPTALAIEVNDELPEKEFEKKINLIENISFERTGELLTLDAIALRNKSENPEKFKFKAQKLKNSKYPIILCSFNPKAMEEALKELAEKRPIIYAATENNLESMATLALKYECPLTLFVPGNLKKMKKFSRKLQSIGVKDLILDPGTFTDNKGDTMDNFVMIRRLAIENRDEDFRFPLIGIPALVRLNNTNKIENNIREASMAAILMNRYADIMILSGTEIWELMPIFTLRQALYTDPRKPQSVDPGIYEFGDVDENSPVLLTTNFSLTYYTVEGDIKSGNSTCYLLVLDTEGRAVDVSVAGGQLNGTAVADLIKDTGIEKKVKHRNLIIPGLAAPVSGEIEDATRWEVIIGPRDSSEIPEFLKNLEK